MLRATIRVLAIATVLALVAATLAKAEDDQHKKQQGGQPHPSAAPHGPPPGPVHPGPPGPPGGGMAAPQFHRPPPGQMGGPPHPPAAFVHPGPGGPPPGFAHGPPPPGSPHFTFHGRDFNRVHVHPFIYPNGWAYRQWTVGATLPPLFLAPDYYYPEWAQLGLEPPPPGTQWVRYGPDLLLVDVNTGEVIDVAYGVFYDD